MFNTEHLTLVMQLKHVQMLSLLGVAGLVACVVLYFRSHI